MSKIELKFISTISGASYTNKGTNVPDWYKNEDDYSTWYITPRTSYYYNILNNDTMYIQYGRNEEGWGSGRFFVQWLKIEEETELPNGDVKVKLKSSLVQFKQRRTEMTGSPYDVIYNLKIFGETVFSYVGNAGDRIDEGQSKIVTKEFIIKPQETLTESGIEFNIKYPNGEANDSKVFLGFGLFNKNPKTYVPMAIRKKGKWRDLNTNNGKIFRRIRGSWVDKSNEDINTIRDINKGKNRIRKSNNWRQLPPMIGD